MSPNIWATFVREFADKKFQKPPILAALANRARRRDFKEK